MWRQVRDGEGKSLVRTIVRWRRRWIPLWSLATKSWSEWHRPASINTEDACAPDILRYVCKKTMHLFQNGVGEKHETVLLLIHSHLGTSRGGLFGPKREDVLGLG